MADTLQRPSHQRGAPPKRKRLILHIGMHKTGSTSIQHFFSRNRRLLGLLGLCYPASFGPDGRRQPKHNALFTAISHEADFGAPHPVLGPADALLGATMAKMAAARGHVCVLSAEGFSGPRPDFAAALAPLAEGFDVTVVALLRRQDFWVESFYKQMVLSREVRLTARFEDFLRAPSTRAHMDYAAILGWWAHAFGEANVRVAAFGPRKAGPTPLSLLVRTAGLDQRLLFLPHSRRLANPSPTAEEVEHVRAANAALAPAPAIRRRGRKPKNQAYLTDDARRELLAAHEHGNSCLSRYLHSCTDGSPFAEWHNGVQFREMR